MAIGRYIKISTSILDNCRIARLSDKDWKAFILSIANNPRNWRYDVAPARSVWSTKRKAIAPQVFARDTRVCKKCGSTERLEIDHIIPLARGGSNDLDNLQVLCQHCNRTKSAKYDE